MRIKMSENPLKINYKVFLEAEDVSQSRILSTASYVRNLFQKCGNCYFNQACVDDESDMDEFALRLYVDETIEENVCRSPEDAEEFAEDMRFFLDTMALANSFLDMEGSFTVEYEGKIQSCAFHSASGEDSCVFVN